MKDSFHRLLYLLEASLLCSDDIELNSITLTWPQRIDPVFEENDDVSYLLSLIMTWFSSPI